MNREPNGVELIVFDPPGRTGKDCGCGKDAMFILQVNGIPVHLCEICTGELGKRIIDALV